MPEFQKLSRETVVVLRSKGVQIKENDQPHLPPESLRKIEALVRKNQLQKAVAFTQTVMSRMP